MMVNIRNRKPIDIEKIFSPNDIKKLSLKVKREIKKNLKMSLVPASTSNIYSELIEFTSKWFYSKFPDDFFNSKYIDDSHVLDQMRRFRLQDLISATRPSANIKATIDMNYNRDGADIYNYGLNLYHSCSFENSFFHDLKKNLFLTIRQEMVSMDFNFKIRLSTRSEQLDIANMCKLAFKINGSETCYVDIDYHIPEKLMLQLAYDSGFDIKICLASGKETYSIVETVAFLKYLNSHSGLPILYKFDPSRNRMKFFIKNMRCPIHLVVSNLDVDEGNQYNMTTTDFYIQFQCNLKAPAPKFFAYHSHAMLDKLTVDNEFDEKDFEEYISTINLFFKIPQIDEHGWQIATKSDYIFNFGDETERIKHGELMEIEFSDLIGELRNIIDYTKSIMISPEVFLNIQVYSHKHISTKIDWINYKIKMLEPIKTNKVRIVIYMDNNFLNSQLIRLREYEKERIQPSDVRINKKYLKLDDK